LRRALVGYESGFDDVAGGDGLIFFGLKDSHGEASPPDQAN
jgi:hypothetical protein